MRSAAVRACVRARCTAVPPRRGLRGSAAAGATAALSPDEVAARTAMRVAAVAASGALLAAAVALWPVTPPPRDPHRDGSEAELSNWSNTHEVSTARYFQPESVEELERLVAAAHAARAKLRPVGSGLSPNGLGFAPGGMVNLALCDKVLSVDPVAGRVTLQAGARLEVALSALRAYGWTLQNFSSIKEQQVGGWTQAGCHGTGASLPPVDEQVVSLKLVTPAKGTLLLDGEANNPELFHLAKVGLGALGIVAEVTLQGVRAHTLAERTEVMSGAAVARGHAQRLATHRHVRYMWLPYTDAVVVVTADPIDKCPPGTKATVLPPESVRTAPLRALLLRCDAAAAAEGEAALAELSFADLRDRLLALNPLSAGHVAAVNAAEAEFWRNSAGVRVGGSEDILGFECGGEQCVSEVSLPAGTRSRPSGRDLDFVRDTLEHIRAHSVPAPAPLEQRWSARSRAPMSPAYSPDADALFCWLGIIMYLPASSNTHPTEVQKRKAVREAFEQYQAGWQAALGRKFDTAEHWAKIELPRTEAALVALRQRLWQRYDVERFNAARLELDPHNILGNELVDALLPPHRVPLAA